MALLAAQRSGAAVSPGFEFPGGSASDEQRFARLYEQSASSVYRFAWTFVRDDTAAEDVCAEVFLRAWTARDSFRGEASALSWLLSITRNCALSLIRSRRRSEETAMPPAAARASDWSDPEVLAIAEVDARALQEAIRRLTEEQQKVIFLRFFEGLRHEEIARVLGSNANAVRALQFRALTQLRRLLEKSNARTA